MIDPVGNFGLSSALGTGGGGGGGGGNLLTNEAIYEPFAPPNTANDMNEEFRVDIGDFVEFDNDDIMTYSIGNYGLRTVIGTSPTNHSVAGFLKSLPVGYDDFTIEAHVFLRGQKDVNLTYALAGIMLSNGTSNTSKLFSYSLASGYNITNGVYAHNWDNYNTPALSNPSVPIINLSNSTLGLFLRIRKNGTTYEFDYSPDGRSWHFIYSINSFYFTPTHCGLMFENMFSTGTDQYGGFSFFRYTDSDVGAGGSIGGRRVWGLGSTTSEITPSGTKYDPFAKPVSSHALDVEFENTIGGLTEFDIDDVMTYAVDDRGVMLTIGATGGGANVTGLLQELPNGYTNFTIEGHTAQWITEFVNTTYVYSGIMLTNGTAADSRIFAASLVTGWNIEHRFEIHDFLDYNTLDNVPYYKDLSTSTGDLFVRIRKDSTNYYFDYSLNGRNWFYVFSKTIASFPFTPTHFGVLFEYSNSSGTPEQTGSFSFLRYKAEDVTPAGFIGGQRINYYIP